MSSEKSIQINKYIDLSSFLKLVYSIIIILDLESVNKISIKTTIKIKRFYFVLEF